MISPIGIPYAKFDPAISRIRHQAPRVVSWFSVWIYCLKRGDWEAAELIRQRNNNRTGERQ